jgi:pSer/pThr/pTyr-binding forkhead associated (FHA) protein
MIPPSRLVFDAGRLSPARRLDAKRNLISSSHWNLLHNAVRNHYETEGTPAALAGVLADRLAAQLLQLTGQTLQTTRDHINHLLEAGLFQRMKGKALHVSLTAEAMRQVHVALGILATRLPALLNTAREAWLPEATDAVTPPPAPSPPALPSHGLPSRITPPVASRLATPPGGPARATSAPPPDDALDATITVHRSRGAPVAQPIRHILDIVAPVDAARRIPVVGTLTVGRAPPADLVLPSGEISRAHCRLSIQSEQLVVTDLKSTNGTRVNGQEIGDPTILVNGDRIQVGSYLLVYRDEAATDMTTHLRRTATVSSTVKVAR